MSHNTHGDRSPSRILFVITTLKFGGAETQVVRLATELKAQGWAVAIACLVPPIAYSEQLRRRGIEVHSLGMRRRVPDPRALLRFRTLVHNFRPDLVHSHMFHANIFTRAARLLCHLPVLICTAHNLREASERGGPTWHKEMLYRFTDFLADRTTIICRAAFERYLRVGAVPYTKFEVIPNAVDTDLYSRSGESRAAARARLEIEKQFVWLSVGRLVKQKDFPTLLVAFEQLNSSNSLLLVAGRGPLENELREQCERLGIAQRVHFCGTSEDLLPLYHAADGFVLASEFEGLSSALLEAASMGLPAVVTDVGGNAEIVLDGVTGHLAPRRNPSRLAAAMRDIEESPVEHRQQFGLAARKHCCANYRIEAVIRQWTDLYFAYLPRPAVQSLSNRRHGRLRMQPSDRFDHSYCRESSPQLHNIDFPVQ